MLTLYINNTPNDVNKKINDKGNRVTLNFASSIDLSKTKYTMRLLQAAITYCMPNIITGKNDLFKYTYNGTNYTYNIPTGLYTLDSLNETISTLTLKQVSNEYVFYFKANSATSQIQTYFTAISCSIDCSGNTNVMSQILGYENDISIGNFTIADDTAYNTGSYKAQLNSLQNILVRSSISQNCSYLNNNSDSIIACITPYNSSPWSTIYYEPINAIKCPITMNSVQQLTIELLDQNNNDLDFTSQSTDNAELWSVVIEILEI